MRKCLLLLIPILLGCQNTPWKKEKAATLDENIVFAKAPFEFNYESQKQRCKELFALHNKNRSNETERKLTSYITDSLLACWYGTPWDFNGTTQTPQQGKIACGYFVTTTLRDAGLTINRVKLAQCASQQLIMATCRDLKKYSNKPLHHFVGEVEKAGYGLYIVGLDNHTGFIFNDGKDVWFIQVCMLQDVL